LRWSPALEAAALLAAALVCWLVFERAGLDDWLTRMAFDPTRRDFPLRDSWWLAVLGHTGIKYAALAAWLAALAIAVLPFPRMRAYRREAAHAAAGMALAAGVVLLLRNASAHSCPWDLAA
jgi:membrane-associated PAP2 superfamily phosphatase